MKQFEMMQLREAVAYAGSGGQALHLHTLSHGHPLFARFPVVAHLFDQDLARLTDTARALGVRVIRVERKGEPGQHIDLCGQPLERAKRECAQPSLF
jgi:hypothetical protein